MIAGHQRLVRGLALSCHPLPTVAVTVLATGLTVIAQASAAQVVLVALTVLTGQLSIGWSNDWIDAARDRVSNRTDKPAATGEVPVPVVRAAALVAVVATVALSFLLGWPPGAFAAVVVAGGWAYNAGLKGTVWSAAAYAVAFGALPALATTVLPGHPLPAWWAVLAGALLGVGAHFANVLPDLDQDGDTGVRGLPHRMGARASAIAAPLIFNLAALVVLDGPAGDKRPWQWICLALITVVCVGGAVAGARDPRARWMFRALVAGALVVVLLFAVSGAALV
ncbi:ubiquinone biosynthesis protein UbiA [Nakamurella silvestris]|nr:ubiquinone biosynthesis protein UbiA [Nakamurella silvestris]